MEGRESSSCSSKYSLDSSSGKSSRALNCGAISVLSKGESSSLIMNIHLRWGIRRRRTQRRRPEIQHNEYATNLLQWGLRRQRIQKNRRPRKPPTRVHYVTRTSSDALPHSVVQHLNLSGHTNDVVQPVQVVRQHNLIASTSNTTALISFGPPPQSVVGHHNINNSESNASHKGKGKGKENQAPTSPVGPNSNVLSKAVLAQRKRRERERNEMQPRQLAQRLRREREQQGKELQSKQQEPSLPRFFPGLTPRPAQRLAYERECSKLKNQFYKHQSLLQPGPSTTQVPNSLDSQSSSEPYVNEWRRIHSTRLRGWGIDNTVCPRILTT
ncbi:hypothetical protein LguiA_026569 [Lonicera macranthoides]